MAALTTKGGSNLRSLNSEPKKGDLSSSQNKNRSKIQDRDLTDHVFSTDWRERERACEVALKEILTPSSLHLSLSLSLSSAAPPSACDECVLSHAADFFGWADMYSIQLNGES